MSMLFGMFIVPTQWHSLEVILLTPRTPDRTF